MRYMLLIFLCFNFFDFYIYMLLSRKSLTGEAGHRYREINFFQMCFAFC